MDLVILGLLSLLGLPLVSLQKLQSFRRLILLRERHLYRQLFGLLLLPPACLLSNLDGLNDKLVLSDIRVPVSVLLMSPPA